MADAAFCGRVPAGPASFVTASGAGRAMTPSAGGGGVVAAAADFIRESAPESVSGSETGQWPSAADTAEITGQDSAACLLVERGGFTGQLCCAVDSLSVQMATGLAFDNLTSQ